MRSSATFMKTLNYARNNLANINPMKPYTFREMKISPKRNGGSHRQMLTGRTFGQWLVIQYQGFEKSKNRWLCLCSCGTMRSVSVTTLLRGLSVGCGCQKHGLIKHGMAGTSIYGIWSAMKYRCSNPNAGEYHNYGGRGIKVCERWQSFSNFMADIDPRPSAKHSLDRINVDGSYEPGNVRWATDIEQCNNTRRNVFYELKGVKDTLSNFARKYGTYPHHFI